ncbi:protein EARLY RESPONSIVE TO DEHYDRATION 15-like [Wolffia australiana]|uniref:Early response to dehydration 15-like protein n=1 Tax=Wolffia australiana TaxID=161112 RepID=H6U7Z4_WOLAU|nr:early response to dehydration 15-like protein [Wolffia australiana]
MEVMSGRSASVLNPHAPLFVPMAYRAVEDFSDDWWALVKTTPWFGDYWVRECFLNQAECQAKEDDDEALLLEIEEIFKSYDRAVEEVGEEEDEKGQGMEMIVRGADKWHGRGDQGRIPKYAEKVPRIVKKVPSPRPIQQPR